MSVVNQANISVFIFSRSINFLRSCSDNRDSIEIVFVGSISFKGISTNCSAGSSLSSFFFLIEFVDCQRIFEFSAFNRDYKVASF